MSHPQWFYDLNFMGLLLAWGLGGFILGKIFDYIAGCFRRVKSRKAATQRLKEMKRREAYEDYIFRMNDPNYYGD